MFSLRLAFALCGLVTLLLTPSASAQTYIIDLPRQLLAASTSTSSYRVTQVVDARPDRTVLGWVQQGIENRRVSANFRRSLAVEMLTHLGRQPEAPTARPVVMRVHALKVAEETRFSSERATAELLADFLLQDGEQYYPLLSVSVGTETKGLDVTDQHAANVAEMIGKSLGQLAALPVSLSPATGAGPLTWAQVERGEGYTPYLYPIQQTKTPKHGIYRTFEQFRNDSPSPNEEPFEVTKQARANYKKWGAQPKIDARYLKLTLNEQQHHVRNAWGISDGQNVYIFQRGEYFQLAPAGAAYTFTGFAPADPGDVTTGAILGGVVGAAIAYNINTGPMNYELSMASGNLQPQRPGDDFAASDSAAVYLYHRADASPATPLTVLVDGKLVGTLGPDQYLPLAWRDRRRDMTICLQSAEELCYTFLPAAGSTTYLAYTQKNATNKAAIKPVLFKEGAFQVKHLKAREKRTPD